VFVEILCCTRVLGSFECLVLEGVETVACRVCGNMAAVGGHEREIYTEVITVAKKFG
jgi:hypothetical protein